MSNEPNVPVIISNPQQSLPNVLQSTLPHIESIISAFNLPREIIASNEEIQYAWRELPREIQRIPAELRNELVARMCVATSVGLFDGAVNYIWNAVIINLKMKVRNFGLGFVAQTLNRNFEEEDLNELMDSTLLDICYKLELLSQEGFFFLNQCRDIRNNFSTAHPSIAQIDDRELINFISRCCKYGITEDYKLSGLNISDFITAIKSYKFEEVQINEWVNRLENTFAAQRQLLFPMLFGIYCDSASNQSTRLNALKICASSSHLFDAKVYSALIDQHNKYLLKCEDDKVKASRDFFERLGMFDLLSDHEKHSIIKNVCTNLMQVHLEYNNFYNEPPFAERLNELASTIKMPDTVKEEYVITVVTCYVGNQYGICRAAVGYYENMIRNFTPREIEIMLAIPRSESIVQNRIATYSRCRTRFIEAVKLLDTIALTPSQRIMYDKYTR